MHQNRALQYDLGYNLDGIMGTVGGIVSLVQKAVGLKLHYAARNGAHEGVITEVRP